MFFESTSVNIGDIKINNADHLATVSFGSNYLVNRAAKAKKTQGFGQQHADSVIRYDGLYFVLDEDILDKAAVKINRNRKRDAEEL